MRESHQIPQENTGNIWNMGGVFPPGIFRIFSHDFRLVPARKYSELTGIHRKSRTISSWNTASMFERSPVFFYRILRDLVGEILGLGITHGATANVYLPLLAQSI
jgi:hypothetical protein